MVACKVQKGMLESTLYKVKKCILPGIATNVFPHDVDDGGPNQRVLDDEGIQIRCRVRDDSAHNWVSSTYGGVIDISNQGSRIQGIE